MSRVVAMLSDEAKMTTTAHPHSSLVVNSSGLEQANGIQVNLSAQFPSFLKQLLKSHLSGKFYLGLPKKFCDAHLSSHDDTIVLVDENDQQYNTKYSVRKNRLSGGWRSFSSGHKLLEGDTLVFHLIEPCKLRVHIMRAGKLSENDGATGLQTHDFPNSNPTTTVKMENQMDANACIAKTARRTYPNSLTVDGSHETKRARLIFDTTPGMGQSNNNIDQFGSNIPDCTRYSDSAAYFKDVKGFEDFKIQSNDLILDSEIPTDLRAKYYKLCCSQNMFLHDRLINGLSCKLTVAMISETIDIADAIRSSDLAMSLHHFECWEKILKAFEDLGMAVGFLRDRLSKLFSISRESKATIVLKMTKRAQAEEAMSNHAGRALNFKALIGSLEGEIEALKWKYEKLGFEFRELARAPW